MACYIVLGLSLCLVLHVLVLETFKSLISRLSQEEKLIVKRTLGQTCLPIFFSFDQEEKALVSSVLNFAKLNTEVMFKIH